MKIQDLGLRDYQPTWLAMQQFTLQRDNHTEDEIWLLEHNPVYTQGFNGHDNHLLKHNSIPVVRTDRGGQITYHGPGQLIVYPLIDLRRHKMGVREMINCLENTVITLLAEYNIDAYARKDAPGVYCAEAKIASLGLRVKRGACYHGLSLNVDMDLQPFADINPCGYPGMQMTDMKTLGATVDMAAVKQQFVSVFLAHMQQGNNT
ncbi:lipoyl(octanoyl) transferase LipB [Methylophaga muralis]|uniref:Octanoyltransferase n=1 Tax=Methylophaga muralis TaxID=291169 RepID=A0A1E3GUS7_9GAMM|nr:lipoyl(octanoyl) transferase LipB [Methylophaga muralis]ODN67316.1 Octanoyltransferase [Methylophaga muralis]